MLSQRRGPEGADRKPGGHGWSWAAFLRLSGGSESSLRSPAAGRDWNPTPLWLSGSKNSFNHFETKDPKVTTPTRTNESQWPLYSTPAPLSQYKVDQRCSTGLEIRIE